MLGATQPYHGRNSRAPAEAMLLSCRLVMTGFIFILALFYPRRGPPNGVWIQKNPLVGPGDFLIDLPNNVATSPSLMVDPLFFSPQQPPPITFHPVSPFDHHHHLAATRAAAPRYAGLVSQPPQQVPRIPLPSSSTGNAARNGGVGDHQHLIPLSPQLWR